MQYAKFDKLKDGDRLAEISFDGEVDYYTFLVYDPGWSAGYAYLRSVYGEAVHYCKKNIEKMYTFENHKEVDDYALDIKAKNYREWLATYERDKKLKSN